MGPERLVFQIQVRGNVAVFRELHGVLLRRMWGIKEVRRAIPGFRYHTKIKGTTNILKQQRDTIRLLSLKDCMAAE